MYYIHVYGQSGPSLLIESTDSMMYVLAQRTVLYNIANQATLLALQDSGKPFQLTGLMKAVIETYVLSRHNVLYRAYM